MSQQFGEKTEQPTPHRLQEARRKGEVVRSNELNSAVNLLAALFLFVLFGDMLFGSSLGVVQGYLGGSLSHNFTDGDLGAMTLNAALDYFRLVGPVFVAVLAAGLLANYSQVGFLFRPEAVSLKLERLNPAEGIKKMFSRRALFELGKTLLKISLVGLAAYSYVQGRFESFVSFIYAAPGQFLDGIRGELTGLVIRMALVFTVLAVADYFYQRHEWAKSLRMTRQEIKDEHRQMEGDPLVKSRQREKQRKMATQRLAAEVPRATVVITNPTELAVALRYDGDEPGAPRLVAKGAALMARRIREIAREHNIPVVENRPVARLLFKNVEIGEEIPVELYRAVAEVLALVYALKNRESVRRQRH